MSRDCGLRFSFIPSQAGNCGQPQVAGEEMRPVIRTLFIEELRFRLPVKPAYIEWAVTIADEPSLHGTTTPQKRVAHISSIEARRGIHYYGVTQRNFIMAEVGVEIVGDARLEVFKVYAHQEPIAIGVDSAKIDWEYLQQRRPVTPTLTDRNRFEWQAERKLRLYLCILRVNAVVSKTVHQCRPTLVRFRMMEVAVADTSASGLFDCISRLGQQCYRRAHFDSRRLSCNGEYSLTGTAVRSVLRNNAVAVQIINAYRVECLQITLAHPGKG